MDRRRFLLVAAIAALVTLFFVLDLGRFLSLEYLSAQRDALAAYTRDHLATMVAGYFLVYVLVTGLSLPGAAIMTLAGGALFGVFWGTLVVSFASSIGATIAFLASRFLLRDWVQQRFGAQLAPLNRGIERDGPFYLFSLRLVPVFPFFVINLVMGLVPISTLRFYLASQLGMLPGTLAYVFAGTQLAEIEGLGDVVSPGLLGAFALLAAFPWIARAIQRRIAARRALAGWQRPARFDMNLVVIGAGSAGLIASLIAATVRARVTLIERGEMGGDCLNTGCVPSKTLITSARVARTLTDAPDFGIQGRLSGVDFPAVMQRVRRAIATIAPNDSVERYQQMGVNVVRGEARIVDPWTVEVDGRRITTRHIVLATGASPLVPPIPGLAELDPLTSDSIWSLEEQPRRLLVMGAGPIGCELAQSFARLGSSVTLVDMAERVLPREDEDVSEVVAAALVRDGVDVRTGHKAVRFRAEGQGGVLEAEIAGSVVDIAFDRVLVAVGRRAVTEGLGLEALGVRTTPQGTVEVDDHLQTAMPTIYACGDVAGPYQFTHMASHQAWYAAVNALFGGLRRFRVNYGVVPWTTYTEPEVAKVGLNETEALERGVRVEVTRFDYAHNDRAIAEGATEGFIKVLTPAGGRDRILGVTIVGAHAGDLLAEYVLAMTHGIGLKKIMGTIHVYPTFAELNKSAASAWRKKHVPEGLLGWVARYHDWLRD